MVNLNLSSVWYPVETLLCRQRLEKTLLAFKINASLQSWAICSVLVFLFRFRDLTTWENISTCFLSLLDMSGAAQSSEFHILKFCETSTELIRSGSVDFKDQVNTFKSFRITELYLWRGDTIMLVFLYWHYSRVLVHLCFALFLSLSNQSKHTILCIYFTGFITASHQGVKMCLKQKYWS